MEHVTASDWNAKYHVGTRVVYSPCGVVDSRSKVETSTTCEAFDIPSNGTWVFLDGVELPIQIYRLWVVVS